MKHPLLGLYRKARHGSFSAFLASLTCGAFFLSLFSPFAWAADGALEALELRTHAEKAIAGERSSELAQAMRDSLPGLLQEYLATRDGTIALDTVDDAFVQEQFKTARAMEEPGVALALDVFSGPGTGYENELRTSISNLADFHTEVAERAAEHSLKDREISDAKLDAFERNIERQLDQISNAAASVETFDSKLDAKLEAKLDAVLEKRTETKTEKAEKVEKKAEKAEEKAEKVAEKVEKKAEKAEEKAEKKAEKRAKKDGDSDGD